MVEDTPFLPRGAISGLRAPGKPLNEGTKAYVPNHQSHFSIQQKVGDSPYRSLPLLNLIRIRE